MTSKTVYTTTWFCDACKKQKEVKSGDITREERTMYSNITYGFEHMYFPTLTDQNRDNDFCNDCNNSFLEWKKSRSAEIINELL